MSFQKRMVLRRGLQLILMTAVLAFVPGLSSAWNQEGKIFLEQGHTLTLEPAGSGSLAGRQFEIYQIFQAETSKDGKSVLYFYAPSTEASVRSLIASRLGLPGSEISAAKAVEYIASLQSAGLEASFESDASEFRMFCQELRDVFLDHKAEPVRTETIPASAKESHSIRGLESGYYLIDETAGSPVQGGASLCLVSTVDADQTLQLKGVYPRLTKKILEDDGSAGWSEAADFETGQKVSFRCSMDIPMIGAYESYEVILHDLLDPALEFQPGSVKVTIWPEGTDPYSSEMPEEQALHLLPDQDYTLSFPSENETFQIRIADLKAILDSRFPKMESGSYGQTVTFDYEALLSSKAVYGRPGMENKARLEYSCDPDSSGKGRLNTTPWEAVVCFSYQLDGLKISEEKKPLEGALFHLFYDEECRQPVFLKPEEDGIWQVVHSDSNKDQENPPVQSGAEGIFQIRGLDQGTFYLKETKAPEGYHAPLTAAAVRIEADLARQEDYVPGLGAGNTVLRSLEGTLNYSEYYDGTSHEVFVPDLSGSENAGTLLFEIINRSGERLPLTGSNTALICLAAGSTVLFAGFFVQKIRRRSDKDLRA